MDINLQNMKPSARTLSRFNRLSEKILGTIRLNVVAKGMSRIVKFSIIESDAPYNAILGTPSIHSMRCILSTYHQCVKFPGYDRRVLTLKGDQRASRHFPRHRESKSAKPNWSLTWLLNQSIRCTLKRRKWSRSYLAPTIPIEPFELVPI